MKMALVLAATLCALGRPVLSQRAPAKVPVSSEALHLLGSADWEERARGFELAQQKPKAFSSPAMAAELLRLFAREQRLIVTTLRDTDGERGVADVYGEGYAEYESAVLDACFRFCDKDGLLTLLLSEAAPGTPGNSSIIDLLGVSLGDSGFSSAQRQRMLAAFLSAAGDTTSFMVRAAGLSAVNAALRAKVPVSARQRVQLRTAALRALQDPISAVREPAVDALAAVAEPADRALLLRIAASDSETMKVHGVVTYPIRDKARAAAARIP